MSLHAIVLAAGQGKRMKSKLYKVLHPVCGKPMVLHVVDLAKALGAERTVVVVGHGAEAVRAAMGERAEFVMQEQQLGTGHAVMQAAPLLAEADGTTIVLYGDTPLLTAETVGQMVKAHQAQGGAVTLLTAHLANPTGYGRIIRDDSGAVIGIVEEKDCTEEQRRITEINTGTYCFDNRKLFAALKQITNENAQGEYYLTDVIGIMNQAGEKAAGFVMSDPMESIGVNDRVALAEVEALMRRRINHRHMLQGVTIIDPEQAYIDVDVQIGQDTVIHPGTILRGHTVIGTDCEIGPDTEITDSTIGSGCVIKRSVLLEAETADQVNIGPYAYLRPGAKLAAKVKVGDFVEIKNAVIGEGSKVPHLSYVGDAEVGSGVNIGCGSITANYDGMHKHKTIIEDDVFIGSNTNLIAPIRIGKGAYVVAGSTITHEVPDGDVAIARSRQTNKPGYAEKIKNRKRGNK